MSQLTDTNKKTIAALSLYLLLFLLLLLPSGLFAQETYRFERLWPVLPQPWYFNNPEGVAVDHNGNLYVADTGNNRIQKFTADGFLITTWGTEGNGTSQFKNPSGIAVDAAGNVYVADSGNYRVQKFNANGEYLTEWGGPGYGNGQFERPQGIAVDNNGNVYVTDAGTVIETNRIQKFTSEGQFIKKWGYRGNGLGEFDKPCGIAIGPNNDIYVADSNNGRIQKINGNDEFSIIGSPGEAEGKFGWPQGIAIDAANNIYVTDSFKNNIQKWTLDGQYILQWGKYGYYDGQFNCPYGLAIDKNGNVLVSEQLNGIRIQKFTGNGTFITKFASSSRSDGMFYYPSGIAIDDAGNIYVSEDENHRIQKFTPDGQFLDKWGKADVNGNPTLGAGNKEFKWPAGIAFDSNGNVYIADSGNFRIQKFTADGQFITKWGKVDTDGNPLSGTGNGEFGLTFDIAIDSSNNVYVADTTRIQKFTADGQFIPPAWGKFDAQGNPQLGKGNGEFKNPHGIAIDGSNNVYVADTDNHRIQKFASDGTFLLKFGDADTNGNPTDRSGDGELYYPTGVEVDTAGKVYVADFNNRIQKFNSDGHFICKFGEKGANPGQFNQPHALAAKNDDTFYVTDTHNNRIQVFRKTTEGFNSRAIIVAGGGPEDGNNLWDATQVATNFAYRALTYRGFSKNDIYYLSANTKLDLDNNGLPDDVRATPTRYTLWQAITKWVVQGKADTLVLYMADHGGSGTFRLSGSEVLTANELSDWLNTLQQQLSCKIIVVYDACESGTFKDVLAGNNRIIITSTRPGEQAKFLGQGTLCFSSFFWTHILNGLSIEEAFSSSSIEINFAFANQSPQIWPLNVSGDEYIGNHGSHAADNAPQIGDVAPQEISDSTTATLSADSVTDPDGIARVWAVIWPPDYTPGSPGQPVTDLDLASIDMKPVICDPTATGCLYNPQTGEGSYEVSYSKFYLDGTYYIALYAMDRKGNTSLPKLTTISRNYHLTRKAIIVAGETGPDLSLKTIEYTAGLAYNALIAQSYSDNDIYFMSETGVPGVDAAPSVSNLQNDLNLLADTDGQLDLVVYLVGAGKPAAFQMMGTTELTATDFKVMLDELQTNKPDSRVTVIYDGDYSGSFIPPPQGEKPLQGENRIVITSTCAASPAYFRGEGKSSFSSFFWQQVASGAILYDAFAYARSALQYLSWRQEIAFSCYGLQNPLLDADGDGVANEEDDFKIARRRTIGMGIRFADDPPVIGSVAAIEDSTTGVVTIVAEDITATQPLTRVWAVIKQIGYCPGGSGEQTTPSAPLVEKDLTDADDNGTYTVSFNPRDYGIRAFRVSVYAMDEDNNTSAPQETGVQQVSGERDIYEPDDTPQEANPIVVNYGSIGPDGKPIGEAQPHNFHTASDMDWVVFYAVSDKAYTIEAGSLEQNCSPFIELYKETDLTHPVAMQDSVTTVNGKEVVALDWECPNNAGGNYYVRLWNKLAHGGGDQTGYKLKVYDGGALGTTQVTGYIRNKYTNAPIVTGQAFAAPLIEWHDLQSAATPTTDAYHDGSYADGLLPSTYKCTIKAAGYRETVEYVDVPESNDSMPQARHDFYLEPDSTTTSTTSIPTSTTTTVCDENLSIISVTPEQIRIGFGLLPRIKSITVTANVDITGGNLNFAGQRGIMVLGVPKVQGNTITANVLFWGVTPGDCTVRIGQCAAKTIQILRGF